MRQAPSIDAVSAPIAAWASTSRGPGRPCCPVFKALYETLLGSSQGPRMGSFIALYGIVNTRLLIAEALAA